MKRKRLLSLLLAAVLILSLCAGGTAAFAEEGEHPAELAGDYTFVCLRMSVEYLQYATGYTGDVQPVKDHYIAGDDYDYKVTLTADGTGYLFLGADNQGPIDSWSMEGNLLNLKAGVSIFDGTIIDGIMTLDFDDGLYLVFATAAADTSEIKAASISVNAFADLVLGTTEGSYSMFAMAYGGQIVNIDELSGTSALLLNEDGTGSLSFDSESMEITSWTVDGDTITVTMADGSSSAGTLHRDRGVIELNLSGYMAYYGREGADTAAFLAPDSRLYTLYDSIDPAAGAHLKYTVHTELLDSDSRYDVHCKDGVFYSADTVQVSGYEGTTATFYRDGTVYTLKPDDLTGTFVMNMSSSLLQNNPLVMDTLYAAIQSHALRSDYATETRDIDGVSCTVDIYPATGYEAETSFYFDGEGNLIRYVEGPPVIDVGMEIGESDYRIECIDTAVNESLFDITGYQISDQ